MGKKLIINGADFSTNGIKVKETVLVHEYTANMNFTNNQINLNLINGGLAYGATHVELICNNWGLSSRPIPKMAIIHRDNNGVYHHPLNNAATNAGILQLTTPSFIYNNTNPIFIQSGSANTFDTTEQAALRNTTFTVKFYKID